MNDIPTLARNQTAELEAEWASDPRWHGVERPYTAADVVRLRGSAPAQHTAAQAGAERLWDLLHRRDYVHALGAMTGGQAVQMAKAGLAGLASAFAAGSACFSSAARVENAVTARAAAVSKVAISFISWG